MFRPLPQRQPAAGTPTRTVPNERADRHCDRARIDSGLPGGRILHGPLVGAVHLREVVLRQGIQHEDGLRVLWPALAHYGDGDYRNESVDTALPRSD